MSDGSTYAFARAIVQAERGTDSYDSQCPWCLEEDFGGGLEHEEDCVVVEAKAFMAQHDEENDDG